MAGRIPPGRQEAVAQAAYDDRAATFEAENPSFPRQGRWGDSFMPERLRARFRDKVTRHDNGETAGINARTQASIEKAIQAETRQGQGNQLR